MPPKGRPNCSGGLYSAATVGFRRDSEFFRNLLTLKIRIRHSAALTPLHHCTRLEDMRLTVNLEPDLYSVAKSLAKAEDCSISTAVNRLLRRSLPGAAKEGSRRSARPAKRNRFVISRGKKPITADTVRQIEVEDDER